MRTRSWPEAWRALARFAAAVWLAFASAGFAAASEAESLEYQVKASYLFNFLRFIKWPDDSFSDDDTFNLCLVEAKRFGSALDAIAGERVRGRRIRVRRLEAATEASSGVCQLLFIANAAGARPTAVRLQRGLLTIGETPGFLQHGGIINLINLDGRVRFEINQDAARASGLVISSRLLALAVN